MNDPQSVLHHLESNFQSYLFELIEFASIPSVSTNPAFKAEMVRASGWVAARLERAGVPLVEILETAGHPVVYAEWLAVPDAPTILIYGHYDVQPADPLEKWHSAPFEPEVRLVDHKQRLYARGVSDDQC
jgi:acetylornithine deacetylase/succinyl-diaminopimelate desuccinylase-like protein